MDGLKNNTSLLRQSEFLLSVGLLGVLITLLIPLPTFLLDMFLAGNLAVTILLLLITVTVAQPLEISVFPSLLLLLTLSRLSLNVATTRLILLDGDAGRIVSTFGGFVVGGNLVVGLVIFLILVVIQFIVITKGAGRISEVAARFTLDALPGKQMALDAEVNAGLDEAEAKRRRKELAQETEFYGSMDGAGKFVRGDAIAGLIITGINLVGGVLLGVSNGLTVWEAITRYSILTVGDGLVSQIPALVIAISAGILVTKATTDISLGDEIGDQLFANNRPLLFGAAILSAIALTPGLPKLPFIAIAAVLIAVSRNIRPPDEASETQESAPGMEGSKPDQQFDDFIQADQACIEIGVRLIPLVNAPNGLGLADRVTALRKELTDKYGIWIPSVRIRDSFQLAPDEYRICVNGREVARSILKSNCLMAISPTDATLDVEGEETRDPAFGLKAMWIPEDMRARAEMKGMTVADLPTVLITHLGEVLRRLSHELLSREDLQRLIAKVRESSPSVVDELKPELIRMGDIHQVLSLLLKERIPLTNLARILEGITQYAEEGNNDPARIAEEVREYLGRDIFSRLRTSDGRVSVIVFDPRIEMLMRESMSDGRIILQNPGLENLLAGLHGEITRAANEGRTLAILTDRTLRRPVRTLLERSLPDTPVVAFHEVPSDIAIDISSVLKFEPIFGAAPNVDTAVAA